MTDIALPRIPDLAAGVAYLSRLPLANPVQALEILCHWLDGDGARLIERAAAAQRLGRPRAAFDIAEQAFTAAARGARPMDKKLIDFPRLTDLLDRFKVPRMVHFADAPGFEEA